MRSHQVHLNFIYISQQLLRASRRYRFLQLAGRRMDGRCRRTAIRTRGGADRRRAFGSSVHHALVTFGFALIMMAAQASKVPAADIQQINFGPHILYVPKAWMTRAGVTAYAPPNIMVQKPQPTAIDATDLSFRPGDNWLPYGSHDLPDLIRVRYGKRYSSSPLNQQFKRWLDEAASREPDSDGFVRVAASPANRGQPPMREIFLYKGYLNKLGEPLAVEAQNMDSPLGNRWPSTVTIGIHSDIGLQYYFSNRKFSESLWWDLYQHVLALFDYLQTPK